MAKDRQVSLHMVLDNNADGDSDSNSDDDTSDLDRLGPRDSSTDRADGLVLRLLEDSKSREKQAVRVSSKPKIINQKHPASRSQCIATSST